MGVAQPVRAGLPCDGPRDGQETTASFRYVIVPALWIVLGIQGLIRAISRLFGAPRRAVDRRIDDIEAGILAATADHGPRAATTGTHPADDWTDDRDIVAVVLNASFADGPTADGLLTVATCHGLIRTLRRTAERGFASTEDVVAAMYQRWLDEVLRSPVGYDPSDASGHPHAYWERHGAALRESVLLRTVLPGLSRVGTATALPTVPAGLCRVRNPYTLGAGVAACLHQDPLDVAAGGLLAVVVAELSQARRRPGAAPDLVTVVGDATRALPRTGPPGLFAKYVDALLEGRNPAVATSAPHGCLLLALADVLELPGEAPHQRKHVRRQPAWPAN